MLMPNAILINEIQTECVQINKLRRPRHLIIIIIIIIIIITNIILLG